MQVGCLIVVLMGDRRASPHYSSQIIPSRWADFLLLSVCLILLAGDALTLCFQVAQLTQHSQSMSNICMQSICHLVISGVGELHLNPDQSVWASSAAVEMGGATLFPRSLQVTQFAQHALFPDGVLG